MNADRLIRHLEQLGQPDSDVARFDDWARGYNAGLAAAIKTVRADVFVDETMARAAAISDDRLFDPGDHFFYTESES